MFLTYVNICIVLLFKCKDINKIERGIIRKILRIEIFITGELLVIVEYCCFGNLHNYLLRHRDDFINQIDPNNGKFDFSIGADKLTRTVSVSSNNRLVY